MRRHQCYIKHLCLHIVLPTYLLTVFTLKPYISKEKTPLERNFLVEQQLYLLTYHGTPSLHNRLTKSWPLKFSFVKVTNIDHWYCFYTWREQRCSRKICYVSPPQRNFLIWGWNMKGKPIQNWKFVRQVKFEGLLTIVIQVSRYVLFSREAVFWTNWLINKKYLCFSKWNSQWKNYLFQQI